MNLKKLLGTMEGLSAFAKLNVTSNTFLSVAVCALVINQLGQHETTRLIPPNLDKEVRIGWNTADEAYLKSFGLYASVLMGNVTPKNVNFVADSVSAFVDPAIYPEVRKKMFMLANDPVFNTNAGSISWSASKTSYEKETSKVFIVGTMESRSATGQVKPEVNVVEYVMKIRDGRPVIEAFDTYPGSNPKTLKWIQAHPPKPAEQTKETIQ